MFEIERKKSDDFVLICLESRFCLKEEVSVKIILYARSAHVYFNVCFLELI